MGRAANTLRQAALALACLWELAGCDATGSPGAPRASIVTAIAQLQPNPDMAAFFVSEARRAGVSDIVLINGGSGGAYGSTSMNSDTRSPVIRINVDRAGAASATNIAHEISHADAFHRNCFNHGERWLAIQMAIAQRFEARFPGVKWSGLRPTVNVANKAVRYPNDHC